MTTRVEHRLEVERETERMTGGSCSLLYGSTRRRRSAPRSARRWEQRAASPSSRARAFLLNVGGRGEGVDEQTRRLDCRSPLSNPLSPLDPPPPSPTLRTKNAKEIPRPRRHHRHEGPLRLRHAQPPPADPARHPQPQGRGPRPRKEGAHAAHVLARLLARLRPALPRGPQLRGGHQVLQARPEAGAEPQRRGGPDPQGPVPPADPGAGRRGVCRVEVGAAGGEAGPAVQLAAAGGRAPPDRGDDDGRRARERGRFFSFAFSCVSLLEASFGGGCGGRPFRLDLDLRLQRRVLSPRRLHPRPVRQHGLCRGAGPPQARHPRGV